MKSEISNQVNVIGATEAQLSTYNNLFSVRWDDTTPRPPKILTDEQIRSVPDQIFSINLSNNDKRLLLLDCFVPYTEQHLSECADPEMLNAVFIVENNHIVYFYTNNGDFKELTSDNCKYLE